MNDLDTLHTGHGEHKTKSFLATSFNSLTAWLTPAAVPGCGGDSGGGGAPGAGPADMDKVLQTSPQALA